MIKVNVVCVGKVKEDYYIKAIQEYSKRLSRFCEFSIKEVREYNYQTVDIEKTLLNEGAEIKKFLKGYVICLAIEGEKLSSEKLATKIEKISTSSYSEITFVIGGSYGIEQSIKNSSNYKLSFSDMTFPHTLMRVMVTEQLYRAFTILNGVSYHK